MHRQEMSEPDQALPRQTGLEVDNSDAPNVPYQEYIGSIAKQVWSQHAEAAALAAFPEFFRRRDA